MSDRRHSVSGDHRRHRSRYDRDYDSAYASREDDDDYEPYDRRRRESSHRGRMSSPPRRLSPDRGDRRRGPRGRQHYDDYDPRDKYYLSGEEDIGFHSQSQQPQRTPWDNSSTRSRTVEDDYFSRRRHSFADSHSNPSHTYDRDRSHRSRHHSPHDYHDRHHSPHDAARSSRRRGAPPMLRRQSSSAPPPSSRSTYPPSSSQNRHARSRYPPSTTETRNYHSGSRRSRSNDDHQRSRSNDHHRRGRDRDDDDRHNSRSTRSRSKSKSKSKADAFGDIPWSQAARCALEAGTMAALRSYDKPGNWIGTKGAQIATAAMGAALVDGVIANKKPNLRGGKRHAVLRQVTNSAIGNLIMQPAGKTVEQKQPVNRAAKAMGRGLHRHGRH